MLSLFAAFCLLTAGQDTHPARDTLPFQNGQRVLILGDSNTYAGTWVQYLEMFLFTHYPDRKIEVINLGLPSETVSGLSEPDHPYPRPWLHERLDRALRKIKPDWVIACYGMNDGIYYPFSEDRFKAYQAGMRKLVDKVKASGARLILLTPMPFDPVPVKSAVRPAGAEKFSWVAPFEGYDEVLSRYSEWLMSSKLAPKMIDIHTPIDKVLKQMRFIFPAFHFAGDGVHLDAPGYLVWATHVLSDLNVLSGADAAAFDAASVKIRRGSVAHISKRQGAVSFDWTVRPPVPASPNWRAMFGADATSARMCGLLLIVSGLPSQRYAVFEGSTHIGEVDRSGLASGIDLSDFPRLSILSRSAELLSLVRERERLLALAWLTEVGYKRPDMPAGKPLNTALAEAAALEAKIRELARPVTLTLRLEPVNQ